MLESQYKMNLIKIGLKISYYRKLQGMTQEELAEAIDLSAGYLAQLEAPNCFFCPSLKTLFKIAEVLGTTVSKLTDIDD
ncbi:MAG: helix-turn-helix transcriptional regulator [Clostridia bacterium]|nr:helix-turn-helix transcriptional regulator [Clostridia bacterium]